MTLDALILGLLLAVLVLTLGALANELLWWRLDRRLDQFRWPITDEELIAFLEIGERPMADNELVDRLLARAKR